MVLYLYGIIKQTTIMSNSNSIRNINKEIRQICQKNLWNPWFTYNDKRKDESIRVKFCANGALARNKSRILKEVSQYLFQIAEKGNITIEKVDWIICHRFGYGDYDALIFVYKK